VRGHKASGNIVLAEGQLHEVPPALTSCESQDIIHLDWEGEMKCNDNVSVGSFVAGDVTVKVGFSSQNLSLKLIYILCSFRTSSVLL
jgi:hypothetical protein